MVDVVGTFEHCRVVEAEVRSYVQGPHSAIYQRRECFGAGTTGQSREHIIHALRDLRYDGQVHVGEVRKNLAQTLTSRAASGHRGDRNVRMSIQNAGKLRTCIPGDV